MKQGWWLIQMKEQGSIVPAIIEILPAKGQLFSLLGDGVFVWKGETGSIRLSYKNDAGKNVYAVYNGGNMNVDAINQSGLKMPEYSGSVAFGMAIEKTSGAKSQTYRVPANTNCTLRNILWGVAPTEDVYGEMPNITGLAVVANKTTSVKIKLPVVAP